MQALIDFDGWRKWKDFSSQSNQSKPSTPLPGNMGKSPKSSSSAAGAGLANGKVVVPASGGGKKKKDEKEQSGMYLGLVGKEKVGGVSGDEDMATGRERDASDETTGTGTDTNGDEEGK